MISFSKIYHTVPVDVEGDCVIGLHVPGNGVKAEEHGLAADPTTVVGSPDHPE